MTNSSHLVWLLKRITLIANRKLKKYSNNKDKDDEINLNNLTRIFLTHNKFGIQSNIRDTTSAGK